jgi:hypothetical protein
MVILILRGGAIYAVVLAPDPVQHPPEALSRCGST